MKIVFLFLITLSCTLQNRYQLRKQTNKQSSFQNKNNNFLQIKTKTPLSEKQTYLYSQKPSLSTENINISSDKKIIADMKSDIDTLNTSFEKLTEKVNSLESRILVLKNKEIAKQEKTKIKKIAKNLIKKKTFSKKKKRKKNLGNFASAQQAFAKKQWESAIQNYEKYRTLNPRGNSYALATYRIALSLEQLGLKEEANSFYSEILNPSGRYAKSKIAKKIRAHKKNLNKKK